MTSSADVTATFCATLADEWVRRGVTDVVVCPGSRSTPLALAVAAEAGLRVHVHHDERSGAFVAVGLGLATGRPAVVVTTSGTAVAELHPAVVEAHQARVPLVVASADRPPELQGIGAPQTIDQVDIFGGAVRQFVAPGVPDDESRATWRSIAGQSVSAALGPVPGPVHLNLAFREPLVGVAGELPPALDPPATVVGSDAVDLDATLAVLGAGTNGVVVAGALAGDPTAVHQAAAALRWPVLADPRSGARLPLPTTVAAADAIVRDPAAATALTPDVVVRLGELPASKVLNAWLDGTPAPQVLIHPSGARIDPAGRIGLIVTGDPADVLAELATRIQPADPAWLASWSGAEAAAQAAVGAVLASHPEPTEPGIARDVLAALPDGATLVTSSSMPVRDVEWYGRPRVGVRVLANRGANGIDGVTSTAVGVALGVDGPTALLIGDVAFLHDTNGLLGLARRSVDLTIVVVDNDGGGIFSFLPQRTTLGPDRFEQLFGTPHGVDLAALAGAHGIEVVEPKSAAATATAVARSMADGGTRIVLVHTDRDANVQVHDEIHAAVAAAVAAVAAQRPG